MVEYAVEEDPERKNCMTSPMTCYVMITNPRRPHSVDESFHHHVPDNMKATEQVAVTNESLKGHL